MLRQLRPATPGCKRRDILGGMEPGEKFVRRLLKFCADDRRLRGFNCFRRVLSRFGLARCVDLRCWGFDGRTRYPSLQKSRRLIPTVRSMGDTGDVSPNVYAARSSAGALASVAGVGLRSRQSS
jgi:hypothetical protein